MAKGEITKNIKSKRLNEGPKAAKQNFPVKTFFLAV